MHSKDRMRTTLRKPTQHSGTKHDASVLSKARSLAVDRDRKVKRHAPNMQARVVSWKRQMSGATLWRLGVMPPLNIGLDERANFLCLVSLLPFA